MNREKPRIISFCLAIVMLLSVLNGCAGQESASTESESPSSPETVTTQQPASTPETTSEQPTDASESQLLDYTWNAYAFSELYRQVYGEEMEQLYYTMVDAVIAGEQSVACPDDETMYTLDSIMRECFPPYPMLISDYFLEDGEIYLTYAVDDEQREQLMDQFENQVAALIGYAGVMEGDSPTAIAIELYRNYSQMITYDYDALDDEAMVDVSSYRAIMELSGICQSFAGAYAYLCLQCGVEAVVAGGMTESFEAHEWTLLTLDGQYYYADPTFENGDGGMGLRYFGMTAAQRELQGGFIADEYNIGDTNLVWGSDIDVTDERFAPLWDAAYVVDMQREDGVLLIQCEQMDGTLFEFVVE